MFGEEEDDYYCEGPRPGQKRLLEEAIVNHLNARVRRLLEDTTMGPDDALNTRGEPGLFLAVAYRNLDAVRMLVEFGADVHRAVSVPATLTAAAPLSTSSSSSSSSSASSPGGVKGTAAPTTTTTTVRVEFAATTPVALAARMGEAEILETLCRSPTFGAGPLGGPAGAGTQMSLYDATWNGHLEAVRVLLAYMATG